MHRPILIVLLALLVLAGGASFVFFIGSETEADPLEGLEIPFEVQPINM